MIQDASSARAEARFVRVKKVVTLGELMLKLSCSRRTAQRRLSQWEAIRSYNSNGRYYTLPDIPQFDANGLWHYRDIFFSRFGSLPETFVALVAGSPAGLTACEAGALLALRPSSFLWSLRNHPGLMRQKHMGRYLYLSSEPARARVQMQQRGLMCAARRLPTSSEAIAILIEKIKYPELGEEELSRRLEAQKIFVTPGMIQDFFVRHDLSVKKTPRSV